MTQLVAHFEPLYRQPVLCSDKAVHAHVELNHRLAKHNLRWGRGKVNTRLFHCSVGPLEILSLRYGATVEIQAEAFDGFCLVQMPLSGRCEFHADGHDLRLEPNEVGILKPQYHERVRWDADCEQILVKVPDFAIRRALCDAHAIDAGEHASARRLSPEAALTWQSLLQQAMALATDAARGWPPLWHDRVIQSLALFVWLQGASDGMNEASEVASWRKHHAERCLRRMEQWVLDQTDEPVSLANLAQAAGLGERALTLICRRYRQNSPVRWARNLRLEAVRRALQSSGPGASVTEIALAHGFAHGGRLATWYHERFGELPVDTLRRR